MKWKTVTITFWKITSQDHFKIFHFKVTSFLNISYDHLILDSCFQQYLRVFKHNKNIIQIQQNNDTAQKYNKNIIQLQQNNDTTQKYNKNIIQLQQNNDTTTQKYNKNIIQIQQNNDTTEKYNKNIIQIQQNNDTIQKYNKNTKTKNQHIVLRKCHTPVQVDDVRSQGEIFQHDLLYPLFPVAIKASHYHLSPS